MQSCEAVMCSAVRAKRCSTPERVGGLGVKSERGDERQEHGRSEHGASRWRVAEAANHRFLNA